MTRVLLFGGSGQVGSAFQRLASPNWNLVAPSSTVVSLTSGAAIRACIDEATPDVIVNAAAYTRVDDAESDRDAAFAINATAPIVMAEVARIIHARFIHVSTDYVFNGLGEMPYAVDAPTQPVNVYGASKLAGERGVREANPSSSIVRTAWVHSGAGTNFVGTAVRLLTAGKSMRVVDDQVGTPTRAAHLADALSRLITLPDLSGVFHFTDAGVASWYDVACEVLKSIEQHSGKSLDVTITPVRSAEFPRPAQRPHVSLLDTHDTRALLGWTPPHWSVGVSQSTLEWLGAWLHA